MDFFIENKANIVLATAVAIILLYRRNELRDAYGNVTARPLSYSWAILLIVFFFFSEFLSDLDDPFYQKHPENHYVTWALIIFGLAGFVLMRLMHTTVANNVVVEHMPFWTTRTPVAALTHVEVSGGMLLMKFDSKTSTVPSTYSGGKGMAAELKRLRPDLF